MKSFLLRHNIRSNGLAHVNKYGVRKTSSLVSRRGEHGLSYPAQKIVCQEYIDSITEANARVKRLDKQILYHTKQWRLYSIVESLMSLCDVRIVVAVTMIA